MRTARLGSVQGALHDGLSHIQHEREFKRRSQFSVEGTAMVRHRDILKALLQFSQSCCGLGKLCARSINAGAFLHRLLHLGSERRDALAPPSLAKKLLL